MSLARVAAVVATRRTSHAAADFEALAAPLRPAGRSNRSSCFADFFFAADLAAGLIWTSPCVLYGCLRIDCCDYATIKRAKVTANGRSWALSPPQSQPNGGSAVSGTGAARHRPGGELGRSRQNTRRETGREAEGAAARERRRHSARRKLPARRHRPDAGCTSRSVVAHRRAGGDHRHFRHHVYCRAVFRPAGSLAGGGGDRRRAHARPAVEIAPTGSACRRLLSAIVLWRW